MALGVILIVRALLEPMPGATPACARCGHVAADMVDFTCPGCRHDVREAGLFAAPADSAAARFWRAAAITMAAVVGYTVVASTLMSDRQRRNAFETTLQLGPASGSSSIASVEAMLANEGCRSGGKAEIRLRIGTEAGVVDAPKGEAAIESVRTLDDVAVG